MTIIAQNGEAVPIHVQLGSGAAGKFPRATIYDNVGAPATGSPVALAHVAGGLYLGQYVVPAAAKFIVQIEIFNDAGFTIPDTTNLPTSDEIVANLTSTLVPAGLVASSLDPSRT